MSAPFLGPTDETRRDLANPAGWAGVNGGDLPILERFLGLLEVEPDEMHTHVGCGVAETDEVLAACNALPVIGNTRFARACDLANRKRDASRRIFESLWPRRIDCMLRFGSAWWLIEAKVDAAHYVLGQCLCYVYWLSQDCPGLRVTRVVVATNKCDDGVERVLKACGVDVIEVGNGLESAAG